MPKVTYKSPGGKTKVIRTSYTPGGKKKAKSLAKKLGGKVSYGKAKKTKRKGQRV